MSARAVMLTALLAAGCATGRATVRAEALRAAADAWHALDVRATVAIEAWSAAVVADAAAGRDVQADAIELAAAVAAWDALATAATTALASAREGDYAAMERLSGELTRQAEVAISEALAHGRR